MQIIINIDDTKDQMVIDAFKWAYDYATNNQGATEIVFTKAIIRKAMKQFIKGTVKSHRLEMLDFPAQEDTVAAQVDTDLG